MVFLATKRGGCTRNLRQSLSGMAAGLRPIAQEGSKLSLATLELRIGWLSRSVGAVRFRIPKGPADPGRGAVDAALATRRSLGQEE